MFIVTQEEAIQKEKTKSTKKSTWEFYAENVRDFAFASSRKFIWDAQAVKVGTKTPLAQSLYPKEGNPFGKKNQRKQLRMHWSFILNAHLIILIPLPILFTRPTREWSIR